MDYCKYHPVSPATYRCPVCEITTCDHCVVEQPVNTNCNPRCILCSGELESLGAVNSAIPFWRRLEASFRYPLKGDSAVVIIAIAILSVILNYLPLGYLGSIFLTGAFIKYCFACLESTSKGQMKPPDIRSGYEGGVKLMLRVLLIPFGIGLLLFGVYRVAGSGAASFLGILSLIALPAILILFALTDRLVVALNPLKVIGLITSIGLPYGLLLAFVLIMVGSVGILGEWVNRIPLLASLMESMVSSYYLIVLFHIMGYMIFQYQGKLGYTAREQLRDEKRKKRTERDRLLVRVDALLKEGEYGQVFRLLKQGAQSFPDDAHIQKQLIEFILATNRRTGVVRFGSRFLDFLIRTNQEYLLNAYYKRILQLDPGFIPDSAQTRHRMAKVCLDGGDLQGAIKLINGMHKLYPEYEYLVSAFRIMLEALEQLPKRESQVNQCKALIKHIETQNAENALRGGHRKPQTLRDDSTVYAGTSIADDDSGIGRKIQTQADTENSTNAENDLPAIEFKL
ncbi:tetratricopeptide repeat domain protein [Oleiphilus messinensis]|uniref:Tetratricopeptide repeat domain protein n=1 Tax=Oleiphilus messinensis TaxID=141451 RepID=A0A1Y0I7S1_9GAMM|nr:hypothetical protein [Oleiphilus messinensis]ARU56501.1 tetratricopeptide repeat domain protein [Oleiphilus messinensis]